jgi:putative ABC transport system ATP-binding protein
MGSIVSVVNVTKIYKLGKTEVPALRGVSLDVHQGEFLSIAGPSGSGKTTLLNLVGCVDVPTSGRVVVGGEDTMKLTERALTSLRLHRLGFIFQTFNLVQVLSVFQNVEFPLLLQGELGKRERAARVLALHEAVGLQDHVRHRPSELSGGQRQRVALARALLADAPMLLLDDTLSAVDTDTEARILAHLRRSRVGRTTIVVSHRLSAVADADEIVVLREGRVVEQGDHAALLAANGWYARQWRYQQLEASLDAG